MSAETPPTAKQAFSFRPDIQGIRALAVLIVIVNHLTPGLLPGGFVGVDVFFVVSGYLITSLLLGEATQRSNISLGGFYARRARRILPAATVVTIVTVVASLLTLPLLRVQTIVTDADLGDALRREHPDGAGRHRLLRPGPAALADAALLVALGRGAVLPRVARPARDLPAGAASARGPLGPRVPSYRRAADRGDQPDLPGLVGLRDVPLADHGVLLLARPGLGAGSGRCLCPALPPIGLPAGRPPHARLRGAGRGRGGRRCSTPPAPPSPAPGPCSRSSAPPPWSQPARAPQPPPWAAASRSDPWWSSGTGRTPCTSGTGRSSC